MLLTHSYEHIEALCESRYTWRSEDFVVTLYKSPNGDHPVKVDLMTWMNEEPDPSLQFSSVDKVRTYAHMRIFNHSVTQSKLCAYAHMRI